MVIKIRDRRLQRLGNDVGRRQGSDTNRKGRTGTSPEGPGTKQREGVRQHPETIRERGASLDRGRETRGGICTRSRTVTLAPDTLSLEQQQKYPSGNTRKATGDTGLWKEVKSRWTNLGFWRHLKISSSFNNRKLFPFLQSHINQLWASVKPDRLCRVMVSFIINYRMQGQCSFKFLYPGN